MQNTIGLILYILVYSFTMSGTTMLGGSIFGLEIRDKVNAGTSSAILNAGQSIGIAILPLIGGAILDIGGALSWKILFIFLVGIIAFVSLILLGVMATKKKNYTFNNNN